MIVSVARYNATGIAIPACSGANRTTMAFEPMFRPRECDSTAPGFANSITERASALTRPSLETRPPRS